MMLPPLLTNRALFGDLLAFAIFTSNPFADVHPVFSEAV
jgi:hypothetical protein